MVKRSKAVLFLRLDAAIKAAIEEEAARAQVTMAEWVTRLVLASREGAK